MTFLCGTIFSLDSLPGVAQTAIGLLPLTHTTECIRSAMLGTEFPWVSLAVTAIYMVAFFAIATYLISSRRG